MRRENWLVAGIVVVVLGLMATLLYSVHLFGDRPQAVDATAASQASAAGTDDRIAGERLYGRACLACHGAAGDGRRGTFPPLAGHLPELMARDGGREYVIDVLLYGLSGTIEVDGVTYRGFMAPVSRLDNDEIAGVLNYSLRAWGNDEQLPADFAPVTADEVAGRRGRDLGPADVHTRREQLFSAD